MDTKEKLNEKVLEIMSKEMDFMIKENMSNKMYNLQEIMKMINPIVVKYETLNHLISTIGTLLAALFIVILIGYLFHLFN